MATVACCAANPSLRRRHRPPHGPQRLPLRHLPAHRPRREDGRRADEDNRERGGATMSRPVDIEIEVERYELAESARYRFDLERRDFMRIFGVMGGGLLVVASLPASAQESGRGGQTSCRERRGRMGPHRRAGPHHWLHGKNRNRPEHPDVAGAGDWRRAARAARSRVAGDGRYRSGAVRPGHVRIAVDAANGAAAGARRSSRSRDAARSRGGAVERRPRPRSPSGTAGSWRPGHAAGLRRDHERAEARRRGPCRGVSPSPVAQWTLRGTAPNKVDGAAL